MKISVSKNGETPVIIENVHTLSISSLTKRIFYSVTSSNTSQRVIENLSFTDDDIILVEED